MTLLRFIKLTRPVNLLIIAATIVTIFFLVILPHLRYAGIPDSAGILRIDLFLLLASTVMIAAGGYIINDYFDLKTDRINKPEKIIIGKYIKRRVAMLVHIFLNTIAVGIGAYLSIKYKTVWPVAIHAFSTTFLWIYSLVLKRTFLTGNLLIAFLAFLTPMLTVFTVTEALTFEGSIQPCIANPFLSIFHCDIESWKEWLIFIVSIFAFFAFITNLIREIIKDMADVEGDRQIGCKTVPIVWGIAKTKSLVILLLILTATLVTIGAVTYLKETAALIYCLAGVTMPLLLTAFSTWTANNRKGFLQAGNFLKIAMMLGIGITWFIAQRIQHL